MTRELKLALIVGFALVLTVAVLVSDHLSRASRAEMAQADATTRVVAQAPQSPIRALEDLSPSLVPSAVQTSVVNAGRGSPAETPLPDEFPMREALQDDRLRERGPGGMDEPITIWNGSGQLGAAPDRVRDPMEDHAPIADAARNAGLSLSPAGDGFKVEVPITYTVKPGESLYGIVERIYGHGKYWKQLAQANDLGDGSTLVAGALLNLPEIDQAPRRSDIAATTPEPRRSSTQYSTSRATPKPSATITPKPSTPRPSTPKPTPTANSTKATPTPAVVKTTNYTVRRGDTLGVIAQRTLGTSKRADEIRKLNNLKDPNNLLAGTTLKIPAK